MRTVGAAASGLAACDLTTGYGKSQILAGLHLDIPQESFTIFVGPNGCGKSTLLKSFARLLSPTSGHVQLAGKDINRMLTRDVARKLGLMPQAPISPEGLSVFELVSQGRYPHQSLLRQWTAADEHAVHKAMTITETLDLAQRPVDSLSGGQRQRCWIAMLLAQQTPIILLDEPTTFLDLKVPLDVMNLLAKLSREEGRTVVVVLHELGLAAAYADMLVMIRQGEILYAGHPDEVFTSENLKAVFDLDVNVLRDPSSRRLYCVPVFAAPCNAVEARVRTA